MTSQTIRIGIPGAAGRMGRMLIREIDAAPGLELMASHPASLANPAFDALRG